MLHGCDSFPNGNSQCVFTKKFVAIAFLCENTKKLHIAKIIHGHVQNLIVRNKVLTKVELSCPAP